MEKRTLDFESEDLGSNHSLVSGPQVSYIGRGEKGLD